MGYAAIAKLMGKHPEVAIFRRFALLNAKNLLYFQAELMQLEFDLNIRIERDETRESAEKKSQGESLTADCDWATLTKTKKQWEKFKEIRIMLKEYNEALHLQSIISGLGKPQKHELKVLREMLRYSDRDKSHLKGIDRPVWDAEDPDNPDDPGDPDDLIVIKAPIELDFLTNLFMRVILFFKSYGVRQRFSETADVETNDATLTNSSVNYDDKYVYVGDASLYNFVSKITTVISCVLPMTSIVALYYEHDLGARLGIIAAFIFLLALILVIATDASRTEIFAATAGFAAILVVFVGSTS